MKIVVLSDSHASLRYMRQIIDREQPDAVVHLGDYFSDGQTMAEEYPAILFYAVPGNCDQFRGWISEPFTKVVTLGGVPMMLTHGHCQHVKSGLFHLLRDARAAGVGVVLFGHTHQAYCNREDDGLWVLNPGSCGYGGGSAGIIEAENGQVLFCRLISGE